MKKKKRKKRPGKELIPRSSRPESNRARLFFSRASRMWTWLVVLAAVFGLVVSPPTLLTKQKKISRSVTGLVLDKDENGIAGATVELTDLQTGKKLAIYSEEGGRYKFSDLEPSHDYALQATHQGLSSEVRKVSSFDNRNSFVINLRIVAKEQ